MAKKATSVRKFSAADIKRFEEAANKPAPLPVSKPTPTLTPPPSPFVPAGSPLNRPSKPEIFGPVKPSPIQPTAAARRVADILGTLPADEKTKGFTQEDIDLAQKQGTDVFDPKILRQISAIEQAAQGNVSLQEQALSSFLSAEETRKAEITTAQQQETTLAQERLGNIGVTAVSPEERTAAAFGALGITALVATAGTGAKALSSSVLKLGVGAGIAAIPQKIVSDARAALKDTRSAMDLVIEGAKTRAISPEQAAIELANIQEQINSLERTMSTWGKMNALNWIGGGKDVEVEIANAKRDYDIKRTLLIQAVAAGAIV